MFLLLINVLCLKYVERIISLSSVVVQGHKLATYELAGSVPTPAHEEINYFNFFTLVMWQSEREFRHSTRNASRWSQ